MAEKIKAAPVSRLHNLRRLVQVGMLFILGQWSYYGIFRCPFPVPFVSCGSCPVIACHGRIFSLFWGFWLILPLSVLLFGRAFCGWACPGGLVNQMAGKIAPFKWRLRNIFNRLLPYGKYLGLAAALVLWLILSNPRWAIPIRTGDDIWNSLKLTFIHADQYWLIRTSVVLLFLAGGLFLANLWCRTACPMGGTLEGLKHFSFFNIYKGKGCNDCDVCLKACEMGTRPDEKNCTNCGDCLHSCPKGVIKVGRPGKSHES